MGGQEDHAAVRTVAGADVSYAQVAVALDYRSNLALYPQWQAWLHEHRPPTMVIWGRNDPLFIEPGAHAYLRDVPDAGLHLFDTGQFALEEALPEIAPLVDGFLSGLAFVTRARRTR